MKLYVKFYLQFFVFIIIPAIANSQYQNNKWIVGTDGNPFYHSTVDFSTGVPDTNSCQSSLAFFLTNASICDTTGQLLFYTNGHVVYNNNHDSLYNTSGINPGWGTTYYEPYGMGIPQGALIIPRPGHTDQYLLFYESLEFVVLDSITSNAPINLGYSIIDMTLDAGLGGIPSNQKNLIAVSDTLIAGRITGVKHANGRDWWLLVHHYSDDKFYKVLVTPDSVINYSSQNIGRFHLFERYIMQSCFSPNGDKLVMGLTVERQTLTNIVDLFDFDRCTGLLSNHREIEIPDTINLALGCSFSPNGRWLYASTSTDMYQYDTWDSNINSTRLIVSHWDSTTAIPMSYFHHLLGPDNNIYVTNPYSSNFIHVINEPDSQGVNCNLNHGQLVLSAMNCHMMPNSVNYNLNKIFGSPCDTITYVTSIEDKIADVFPNPVLTGATVKIDLGKTFQIKRIKIIDMFGKSRAVYYENELNSENDIIITEEPGTYIIEIITDELMFAKMLVVI